MLIIFSMFCTLVFQLAYYLHLIRELVGISIGPEQPGESEEYAALEEREEGLGCKNFKGRGHGKLFNDHTLWTLRFFVINMTVVYTK